MKLICMSFDGDPITETEGSMEECQLASENMGSKWFFYPFHFIVDDEDIVQVAPDQLEIFEGDHLDDVIQMFSDAFKAWGHADLEDYFLFLIKLKEEG